MSGEPPYDNRTFAINYNPYLGAVHRSPTPLPTEVNVTMPIDYYNDLMKRQWRMETALEKLRERIDGLHVFTENGEKHELLRLELLEMIDFGQEDS